MPTQDMIIGIYHLTLPVEDGKGTGRAFSSVAEARMAFDAGQLELGSEVKIRLQDVGAPAGSTLPERIQADESGIIAGLTVETPLGRALFNETLPLDYPFIDVSGDKRALSL